MKDDIETPRTEAIRTVFTRSCDQAPARIRSELAKRRLDLLAGTAAPNRAGWRRPLLPAGALATAMAIAGVLWLGPAPQQAVPSYVDVGFEEARLAAEESAASLDEDPEFFLWLADAPVADEDQTQYLSTEGQQR